jgi:gliding motility-associated-like protein
VNFEKVINSSESFAPAADVQHTTCDDDNGMIEVVVAGSTGPYQYRLGNSPYTPDNQFEGLGANTYALSVKDAQGCVVTAQAIVEPSTLPSPELLVDRTHCGVNNGSIDVQIAGGVGPYKYDIGAGFVDSARFENLKPAIYMIVVQDAMGCVDSAQATIDSSERVQALVTIEPTTCGDSNGIITLNAQAGIGPFAFSVGSGLSTENVFQNVPAGMHQVIVQDADDCVFIDSVLVDPSNAIVLDPIVDMTSCGLENGRIQVNASGGTGGLVYTIADSFGLQEDFSLLSAGTYTIQVKDGEECLEERLVEVLPSTNPVLDATVDDTHCGVDNGEIVMKASFGEGPYTYYVDGVVVDSNVVNALSPANYRLMVKDIHECVDSSQAAINPSTAPELSYQTLAASCYQQNGSISISGGSGIAPYQYSIGNAFTNDSIFNRVDSGTYQIILRDSDNCIDSALIQVAYNDQYQKPELDDQGAVCSEDAAILDIGLESAPEISWTRNGAQLPETNSVLSTMDAGLYKVVVTYHEGCVLADSTQIVVHEKPDQPLADQATICLGEQFVIAESNPSYTYQWSNDSIGHAIAFGSSGRYQLKILNEYGCFIDKEIALEVIQPVELTVLNDQLQICEGENMELRVAGADTYQWYSDDSSLISRTLSNPVVSPSADASYLVIGTNQCFEDTLEFSVGIFKDMTIVTADTLVIEGSPLALEAEGALEASWASEQEIDCADCVTALLRPEEPEEVHVLYTDENGCSREAYINIEITPLQEIFPRLVNVITPNHDGMNDVLEFRGIETFRQTKLEVFNQQGLRIYEDKDYKNNWDGTFQGNVLPEGVYFYMISLLLDDRVFHFDSDLTIVRD